MIAQNTLGNVRKAKVLVTNPTHYAVALDYDKEKTPLPLILAMGEGALAQRMMEVARQEGIPIMRNVPLARALYSEGTADEIVLVYQHYRTVLTQEPTSMTLLPIAAQAQQSPSESPSCGDVIFEPDRESVLSTLLDMYIGNTVHAVLLEARCGEHSARMTAMTAAADNTEELIGKLTLELNHARQAAITTELSEIAGGAEALRSSKAE
jgi:ATP synthase F1 gamma subunit